MSLFPEEKLAELDQLRRDIAHFSSLYSWIGEHLPTASCLDTYRDTHDELQTLLPVITSEIRAEGELPSAPDSDRQDLEQLLISTVTTLTGEDSALPGQHLNKSLAGIGEQLDTVRGYDFSPALEEGLSRLSSRLQQT